MSTISSAPVHAPSFGEALAAVGRWARREPLSAVIVAAIACVLVYYYGFYAGFMSESASTASWAFSSWNAENDLEHGAFILPVALFVIWCHRAAIVAAPKSCSPLGLVIVFAGICLFVLAIRTVQPRLGILSLPVLLYGTVRYLWGRDVARYFLFPCAFMLFMIPAGFIISSTVGLQTLAAKIAAKLAGIFGIAVLADGANIAALNGKFHFEVAGGCSGIRSLSAMVMLAALYVHFTQRELWKKVVIFGSSLVFALIGNFMRVFSVVLVAQFVDPELAGGLYHTYSGFVFFPIAVGAMVGFSKLLNGDWTKRPHGKVEGQKVAGQGGAGAPPDSAVGGKATRPSYDY